MCTHRHEHTGMVLYYFVLCIVYLCSAAPNSTVTNNEFQLFQKNNKIYLIFRRCTDLAIDKVFSGDGGVLGFLKLSLSLSGTFVRENNKAFDLFIKITELHKEKVAKYATSVVEVR